MSGREDPSDAPPRGGVVAEPVPAAAPAPEAAPGLADPERLAADLVRVGLARLDYARALGASRCVRIEAAAAAACILLQEAAR